MQLSNTQFTCLIILICSSCTHAFAPASRVVMPRQMVGKNFPLHMSEETKTPMENVSESGDAEGDNEEEEFIDAGTRLQLEKQKRADELRSQEVFMKRSTGIHKCSTCDWEFDEKKGDSFLIGGTVQPGTPFADLPSNWRCPSCRASKDNFQEVTEEIPGFEVNQGYGLGGNAMTSGQKSGLVFGGIFFFFVLMIGGYGLS